MRQKAKTAFLSGSLVFCVSVNDKVILCCLISCFSDHHDHQRNDFVVSHGRVTLGEDHEDQDDDNRDDVDDDVVDAFQFESQLLD